MSQAIDLVDRFKPLAGSLFAEHTHLSSPTLPRSAESLLALALVKQFGRTCLLITEGPHALDARHQDLATLCNASSDHEQERVPLLYFPARESLLSDRRDQDPEIVGSRLKTMIALREGGRPCVLVTSAQALMQHTLAPDLFREDTRRFELGAEYPHEDLAAIFQDSGYLIVPQVTEKGEAAIKGGLIDIWPLTETWPVRMEFFGPELESIRTFDPATQRSIEKPPFVTVPPASDHPGDVALASSLVEYLPEAVSVCWSDMDAIEEHAEAFEARSRETRLETLSLAELLDQFESRSGVRQLTTSALPRELNPVDLGIDPAPQLPGLRREDFQPDLMEQARRDMIDTLRQRRATGHSVIVFFDTTGARDHFCESAGKHKHDPAYVVGVLSDGFAVESQGLTVLAESDIYGRRKISAARYDPGSARPEKRPTTGERVADLAALEPGDLVVHVEHGLGRYMGLRDIVFSGQRQEVISISYAGDATLHLPITHAHLLSRYVGAAREKATLHRLGGKRWQQEKAAAEEAVADLASGLLDTQAQRDLLEGHQFPADTTWQKDFEASFPYRETPDQSRVILEVKSDMESTRPMDRLICGDAGYGKTEVALRAAFKTVMDHRQVAVLVPTTVLAQQHYRTFAERLQSYPFKVAMLSRFCTRAEHRDIVQGLKEGTVDIVIGTHALVQPNIRFKNLGLAIIDEEQRFGVKHKERIKRMRLLVDVLTMTATPIPRTLYLSMTGARDMSLIQTPPEERMAIETRVERNADNVIRKAIMRELNREGQVFYLHNRVMTIERVHKRLVELVPEARIAIAHGQMSAGHLRTVMKAFVDGEHDILLCTTIIESGMDIPRANTILIDRADRFGIADLYQLRGRVGRSSHRGYAYLLLPPHGRPDHEARKRIDAIKRYTALGSGFSLALRDLEIRGAGNLLGAQKS